ncbi:MAG: endonuclease domain-containing protein [Cyanobacteria bacterium P01_A01_bin.17]
MSISHNRIRGTTPNIDQAARQLRRQLTPAEATLWKALRNRRLGDLRFRRQHPIGNFIVDFCCPAKKLIIEVDGEIHQQQQDYGEARTEHLERFGYRVIRFSNEAVENNLQNALEAIRPASASETNVPPE